VPLNEARAVFCEAYIPSPSSRSPSSTRIIIMADIVMPLGLGGSSFPALGYQNAFTLTVGAASVQSNTITASAVTFIATCDLWVNIVGNTPAIAGATGCIFVPAKTFFTLAIPTGSTRLAVIGDNGATGSFVYAPAARG
jgi:hypothetical protein